MCPWEGNYVTVQSIPYPDTWEDIHELVRHPVNAPTREERADRLVHSHIDWILQQEYFLLTPQERLRVGGYFGFLGKSNHHIGPGGTFHKWYTDAQEHAITVGAALRDMLLENAEDDWASIIYYQHIHAEQSYNDAANFAFWHPQQQEQQAVQ